MTEKPILFFGPMVRAILEGRKTMTRRIVSEKHLPWIEGAVGHYVTGEWANRPFPYGKPGDRLWVRETWRTSKILDSKKPSSFSRWPVRYEADGEVNRCGALYGDVKGKIRPAIFMPRWASRLTLEITGVRVERLQEISEADAIAEGVTMPDRIPEPPDWWSYRDEFAYLWDQINGAESWQSNPFVWVIQFKKEETK